ncbi:hypothetical protein PP175_25300 (plasmid) [Aneurinibacillus sp. Ricciae_BoGa-3]|uniref:hypothetical protein n=1 Tax=Aneurinibacillus sp. Ricciae_BoGa-3 TaxID=3022697 RepID=UPI0023413E24|nr:hypothetical protein [Aneurinibacillus sp. Ricciae_BoGa-3]WCK57386.1 hypothetical protein PP175_25300 [Aneurinibacillus sp. Ricciae_BoGa-3]
MVISEGHKTAVIEERMMDKFILDLYEKEKNGNFKREYVTGYVIPSVRKFLNKEVRDIDELNVRGHVPIWDTRNNKIIKKILEHYLQIELTGVKKRDKVTLQAYLGAM